MNTNYGGNYNNTALVVVLRLGPQEYAHITNENENTTKLVVGPLVKTLSSNETVTKAATPFHCVPHGYYAVVRNPIRRVPQTATAQEEGKNGKDVVLVPEEDAHGQVRTRVGEREVRYLVPPFPLYPDEQLESINQLIVLAPHEGLWIEVVASYTDAGGPHRPASTRAEGERYLRRGPGTYYPRVEENVVRRLEGTVVPQGCGLHIGCSETFTHPTTGVTHLLGEKYLYTTPGLFFPEPQEKLLKVVQPYVSEVLKSCVIRVERAFVDTRPFALGTQRQANDQYLLTHELCPSFLIHPYETFHIESMYVKYISPQHFQVIEREKRGREVLSDTFYFRECSDVLVRHGYHKKYLLSKGQSVLAQALCDFVDETEKDENGQAIHRSSGDQWLIKGPGSVMPTKHYNLVHDAHTGQCVRDSILLGEGEGVYVRDKLTGVVRLVSGPICYMLEASEKLWVKPVSPLVRELLQKQAQSHAVNVGNGAVARALYDSAPGQQGAVSYTSADEESAQEEEGSESYTSETTLTQGPFELEEEKKAIVFHIPYRSVTQLYNYKDQTKRLIFGPERVMLEPHEEFTIISLSGSPWDPAQPTKCLPKEPHRISALYLFLGPSNMADVVHVETRDHAQLALQLQYDWFFDVPYGAADEAQKCFTVNDFVGDACSFIASNIRAAVALLPFEEFHKNSAKTLRDAVFGVDPATGLARGELRFPENHLVITSVDIQEMEVLDARTRQGLQKSVKMAIKITTYAQEADAQQVASAREQEASGLLDRRCMADQVANEELRRVLLEAENRGLVYAHMGKSSAMGQAASLALNIEGEATTKAAAMRAEKDQLLYSTMSTVQQRKKVMLLEQQGRQEAQQAAYDAAMTNIQHDLMAKVMAALGPQTVAEMARAGPELQAKLLKSLGLEGYLVTDGSTPINLFQTATGMTAPPSS